MRKSFITMMALFATLFTGCGQSHDAKNMVEEFMTTQMGINDYDVVQWGRLDSTFFVSDSMVQVRRKNASHKVKGQEAYAKPSQKLLFLNVRYAIGNDTIKQTFYLNDKLTGIVSYKEN